MRFYYIINGLLWTVVLVVLILAVQGCAVTTAASAVSYAATGKGVGDHVGSAVTGGDCNVVKHTVNGQYVCEMPVVYNRSGF